MKKEVKKKSRRMSAFLKANKKGSAYYEIIVKTLVFITMIATAISFFSIFTVYLNLNYTCRRVVREIEISGALGGKCVLLKFCNVRSSKLRFAVKAS